LRTRERLDALLAGSDPASMRGRDPVDFVHRYTDPADQEVAGLLASLELASRRAS
jgi:hypothetical protein